MYCDDKPISFIKENNVIEFDAIRGNEYKILFPYKIGLAKKF